MLSDLVPSRPCNLALFDFDGTITWDDSFTRFLLFATPRVRLAFGALVLVPLIARYELGLVRGPEIRAAMVRRAFRGRSASDVREQGARFAKEVIPSLLRPRALERIRWHQARGDRVVVVSASIDVYLRGFCEPLGIDLIANTLEADGGVLTGRYTSDDCTGANKARRVNEAYDLGNHPRVYAYGDTVEDRDLLALAHERFFRWQGFD